MAGDLVTSLQIFGIGFSFGIIGPCFMVCTPLIITYVVGSKKRFGAGLIDISVFLTGRLVAYALLGYLAGLSAGLVRGFANSKLVFFFKPAAGIISIMLGLFILFNRQTGQSGCGSAGCRTYNFTNLFLLGFLVGITPCAPLMTLLFEIALISKNALHGMIYSTSFGVGTFLSGLLVTGAMAGLLSWLPSKLLKSEQSERFFRIACAVLLILLGMGLIFGNYSYTAANYKL